jgi:hypothetical protein
MAITESEALAIAEEAARRVLAARPTPSCVSLTDAAEMLGFGYREAVAEPHMTKKYRLELKRLLAIQHRALKFRG